MARPDLAGPGQVRTGMRCAHILSDEEGLPVHPLRQTPAELGNRLLWSAWVGTVRNRPVAAAGVVVIALLAGCAPGWPPTRASPPTPAPGRKARPDAKPPPNGPPPIAAPKNDLSVA